MVESGRPYSRLLRRLERIAPLSEEDRELIARLPMTVRNLRSHQDVLRDGDRPEQCCLVLDGYLYRHKLVSGFRRQIMSFHVPGDLADLHALHIERADHNLTTLGAAVLAFIPLGALRETLAASPRLTHAFWRDSLVDAAIFREWVINLGQRDALSRIAHIFCEMTLRLQSVGLARDGRFRIPWTQSDLADASGISTVHANRVVQELRRLDLIEWDAKHVHIRNWPALTKIADFSQDYLHLDDVNAPALADRRGEEGRTENSPAFVSAGEQ